MRSSGAALLLAFALGSPAAQVSALVVALEPEELVGEAGEGSGSPASPGATSGAPATPRSTPAAAVVAKAVPSLAGVALGERFAVEVKVTAPPGTSFTFPGEVVTEGAELHALPRAGEGRAAGASPPPPEAPGVHRYEATLFELTDAKVPSVVVKYRTPDGAEGEVATEPVAMKTVSRLAKDADPEKIADIRGPVSLTVGPAFWVTLAVLAAALLASVGWLVGRRGPARGAADAVAPTTDPAAEARQALAALAASGLLERGDHRGFYIVLTAIAKRYLERRLGAPVLEMTTAEMVAFLRDAPKARALVTPMRDLASAADQIKFARGAGLHAEAERHTDAVREVIRTIEEVFTPIPAEQEKVA
jgi:hypothetical protein